MEHPRTTKNVGQPCVICGQPANAQAAVEALRRERDDAVLLRDHNLRRCDVLDSKYKKGLAAVKVLQSQLSQLQALVRAFFTSEDKWAVAYRELERLGYTLDATTPDSNQLGDINDMVSKGGDGE